MTKASFFFSVARLGRGNGMLTPWIFGHKLGHYVRQEGTKIWVDCGTGIRKFTGPGAGGSFLPQFYKSWQKPVPSFLGPVRVEEIEHELDWQAALDPWSRTGPLLRAGWRPNKPCEGEIVGGTGIRKFTGRLICGYYSSKICGTHWQIPLQSVLCSFLFGSI